MTSLIEMHVPSHWPYYLGCGAVFHNLSHGDPQNRKTQLCDNFDSKNRFLQTKVSSGNLRDTDLAIEWARQPTESNFENPEKM